MRANELKLPEKGFTKSERAWIADLIDAIKTVQAIKGKNVSISDNDSGQIINADDCPIC